MKNTLLLVRKDFNLLRNQFLLAVIVAFIAGIGTIGQVPMVHFIMMMMLLSYYSCAQGFYIEEKNDTMTLLGALPLHPNQIILGKYLLFAVAVLVSLAALALLITIGTLLQGWGIAVSLLPNLQSLATGWIAIPIGFCFGALFNAVMIPPVIKLGVMKARWLLFALYIVFFAGIGALTNIMSPENGIQLQDLSQILQWFAPTQVINYVLLMLASLLILYLSYLISCNIYLKKRVTGR